MVATCLSSFFASKFKEAKIFVIEPDPNYIFALLNNKNNPNVRLINAAVWSSSTNLEESVEGAMTTQFRETKSDQSSTKFIKAYSINELLKLAKFEKIDFQS